jgi:hypothetical protein
MLLLLTGIAAAPVAAEDALPVSAEGGHRRIELTAMRAARGVGLPDSLIIAGTDTVLLSGHVLGPDGYILNAHARFFRLTADTPESTEVVLLYRYLPGALRSTYRSSVLASPDALPGEASAEAVLVAAEQAPERGIGPDLRVDGSKTFGISAGSNRDPTLEQSLRLNVNGRIAGDVSVRAYLSDQNVPLRPEGDTEELRALDEVLVELESSRGRATLGDFVLTSDRARLASVRRELSGAQVEGDVGPGRFLMAGARAEGEFRSETFRGIEGKQGQYVLGSGDAIVAGSERVWVDGEPARRGRDNDYVMDYDAGTIEFTETRPVTSETEIAVDYEAAAGDYARDLFAVTAGVGSDDRVGITWLREADDRNSPSTFSLGESERAILAAAGDDAQAAFYAGVDSVGSGSGDYDRIAPGVFEYAGVDSGSYDLVFEREDGGPYEYDYVGGYYVYVGDGSGTHRLGRTLALPASHDIVAFDAATTLGERVWVEGEAAVSSYDANTLSNLDDGDNLGNATSLTGGISSSPFGWLSGGTLSAVLSGRRVGGNFRTPGRFREVGYEEQWELQGVELPTEELLLDGGASISFPEGGSVSLSRASLRRGDDVSTDRTVFAARGRPLGGLAFTASGRLVDVSLSGRAGNERRTRRVYRASVERPDGWLRPVVRYARDLRTTDGEGQRFNEAGAGVRVGRGEGLSAEASYDRRVTERNDGDGWGRHSTTRTEEIRVSWDAGRTFLAETFARRRRTDFEKGVSEPGTRHDLVSARVSGRTSKGTVSGEIRYTVTSTEVEEKEKYVTEEDGVEVTRIISTGRYLPVTELETAVRWSVDGRAGRGNLPEPTPLGRLLSSLSLTSEVKLRESTTSGDRTGLYLLDPDVIQGDDTVEGRISSRHSLRYLSTGGRASARLTFETRDDLDRQYANAPERRLERGASLDLKASTSDGLTWRLVGSVGRRERTSDGALASYSIDERSVLGEVGARRWGDLEAKLSGLVATDDEKRAGVAVTRYEVTPGLTLRFPGRGALAGSVTRAEVRTDEDELPLYLGGGRQPGATTLWRLSGDYRVNSYLTATLSYTGEQREGREAVQTVDLRVSAYF